MRRRHLIALAGLLGAMCSVDNDVAVTQTGNPTKLSLIVKADTVELPPGPAKLGGAALIVTEAFIVIRKAELEPIDGEETVLFQNSDPYIVQLVPPNNAAAIDTKRVWVANTFRSIELEFGPAESPSSICDSLLRTHSILVRGYFAPNPADSFVFVSAIQGSFEYELDSTLTLPDASGTSVLVRIRIPDWFRDTGGALLDPRSIANRSRIEQNILGSVSASESDIELESESDD